MELAPSTEAGQPLSGPNQVREQQARASTTVTTTLLHWLRPANFLLHTTTHWGCETLDLHVWALVAKRHAKWWQMLAPSKHVLCLQRLLRKRRGKKKRRNSTGCSDTVCPYFWFKVGKDVKQDSWKTSGRWWLRYETVSTYFWMWWLLGGL